MPASMPISFRIGPLTTEIVANDVVLLDRAVCPLAAIARITGKYSGRAPAITALTATFSTVNSQNSRKRVGRIRPTTLSRGKLVPLSIFATRSSVGSVTGRKSVQWFSMNKRLEIVLRVGSEQPRRGPVERNAFEIIVGQRAGQPFDQLLHERPLGDRIGALDVGA